MQYVGNIRKMATKFGIPIQYSLPLFDVLLPIESIPMNELIGKNIKIDFLRQINCVLSGKRIRKTYGDGMSYDVFRNSPLAVESIIRPELSQAHLGIGLRDLEWEIKNDVQPHIVYFALTDKVKVGVTRKTQIPTRWIDQGAWKTIVLAETPYRQAAGLMEVELKKHYADRTNWRSMLKDVRAVEIDLVNEKEIVSDYLNEEHKKYITNDAIITELIYPVLQYPKKVKSVILNKTPTIEGVLQGIRGQYLYFEDGKVLNIRRHSGYRIRLNVSS